MNQNNESIDKSAESTELSFDWQSRLNDVEELRKNWRNYDWRACAATVNFLTASIPSTAIISTISSLVMAVAESYQIIDRDTSKNAAMALIPVWFASHPLSFMYASYANFVSEWYFNRMKEIKEQEFLPRIPAQKEYEFNCLWKECVFSSFTSSEDSKSLRKLLEE